MICKALALGSPFFLCAFNCNFEEVKYLAYFIRKIQWPVFVWRLDLLDKLINFSLISELLIRADIIQKLCIPCDWFLQEGPLLYRLTTLSWLFTSLICHLNSCIWVVFYVEGLVRATLRFFIISFPGLAKLTLEAAHLLLNELLRTLGRLAETLLQPFLKDSIVVECFCSHSLGQNWILSHRDELP